MTHVYVAGLATDYCVKFTALDARQLGFTTYLIKVASRGVNLQAGDVEWAIGEMRAAGVKIVTAADVLGGANLHGRQIHDSQNTSRQIMRGPIASLKILFPPMNTDPIEFYSTRDAYGEFSNFSAHPIRLKDRVWPTTEHYFQAQKFPDTPHEEQIRNAPSPMIAARLGRNRSRPLRPDWEQVKETIMREALQAKFTPVS